ncbi:hypothetical protein RIF29_40223 [Crotalaria pallida]|uniref:Reverse transcriptase domain-containing protein n=1 Tax=Crotalaria pallida TaxID=3830 RepID=A0AAN9E2S8_CROPI
MARIRGIQISPDNFSNPFLQNLEIDLRKQLEITLKHEESLWFQKSRKEWIQGGDRNTRYYHSRTISRRRKNRIFALHDDVGDWCYDDMLNRNRVISFFKNLYYEDMIDRPELICSISYPTNNHDFSSLLLQVSPEEIKRALFAMGPTKAPGEDGIPAIFYKHNWQILQQNFTEFIKLARQNAEAIRAINSTLVVLIPKVDAPQNASHFRPIALCNVVYKCNTKIIANRLKPFMNDWISPQQVGFIPGRNIQDNIIIAQELIHSMKRMKRKKSFMTIKFDLEKAYDRLSWGFIRKCLSELNLPACLINLIMNCIITSSFKLLWNGEKTDSFLPSRGVRQGDPLSPFLFVICMDKLSHMITEAVNERKWKPIKAGRHGPLISHLMFADDLLVFEEASTEQLGRIMDCLEQFGLSSGHKINETKTSIFFSSNVDRSVANDIVNRSGFKWNKGIGSYLGSIDHGNRRKKECFKPLVDKLKNKLAGWKSSCLSLAGRTILAKSVLGSLANHNMQHSNLPISVCREFERAQRDFVWGSSQQQRKAHLLSWDNLCLPKTLGGLGFKRMKTFNDAFLMKLGWGILTKPNDLWVQVLKGKYARGRDFLKTVKSNNQDSSLWKRLAYLWPTLLDNVQFRIGNGKGTWFWKDRWIGDKITLQDFTLHQRDFDNDTTLVADMTDEDRNWDFGKLQDILNNTIIDKIRIMPPPEPELGDDELAWSIEGHGNFTVKSAYGLLSNEYHTVEVIPWETVWKSKCPERWKFQLWKTGHDRLLTNSRKSKWGLGTPECKKCRDVEETTMHVLRDCPNAQQLWRILIPGNELLVFMLTDLIPWCRENISMRWGSFTIQEWRIVFLCSIYYLWQWRNNALADPNFIYPSNTAHFVLSQVRNSMEQENIAGTKRIETLYVRWNQPPEG